MNDDRELTDPALDALLRAHSAEAPPAHVDAAILAAAHRAVASAPHAARATRQWRWWMPIAAAAVIGGVVVGILPLSPAIDEHSPVATDAPPKSLERDASGSASTGAPSTLPDAGNARPRPAVPAKTPLAERKVEREAPASPGVTPAPGFASPPEASGALRQNTATADDREDFLARPHSAEEWIARIRALRGRGNEHDAMRALAGFRQAFTDAEGKLPPDLRDWAAALPQAPK